LLLYRTGSSKNTAELLILFYIFDDLVTLYIAAKMETTNMIRNRIEITGAAALRKSTRDNFSIIGIVQEYDHMESDSVTIDGIKYSIDTVLKQQKSRFNVSGVMICEMALIRKIIVQDIETVRLELVPNG
jgi:hypothetical protein